MATPHQVLLTWNASTDTVDGYNVYKGIEPSTEGATPVNAALITTLQYVDLAVVVGQKYDYYVTAVRNGFESVHSNEVITAVILPAAPTNVVASIS